MKELVSQTRSDDHPFTCCFRKRLPNLSGWYSRRICIQIDTRVTQVPHITSLFYQVESHLSHHDHSIASEYSRCTPFFD